jgi:hypothetical protein
VCHKYVMAGTQRASPRNRLPALWRKYRIINPS